MFYQAARSLKVESYSVPGDAGTFLGPTDDVTLIKAYLQGRLWPAREIETLKAFFNGHGTLYDIGANIGMVTVPLAKSGVRIVAFEPDEVNCGLLRANVARNCVGLDVKIFHAAVYREAAMLRFTRSSYNSGDHRLAETGEYQVKAVALDDLTPLPEGPFALKIDTQGAEPGIFEGGKHTIAAAGMVLSEFWPFGIARMGNKPDAILDAVRAFPHGRLIDKRESGWMTGAELADKLHAASRDLAENNDMDFVVARERFSIP